MSEHKVLSFENPTNEDLLTALRVCGDDSKGCRVCPLFKSKPCSNLFDVVADRIAQQAKQIESLQRERQERQDPEQLTLEQLKHMNGIPVFCHIPSENPQWGIVNVDEGMVHIRHGLLLFKYYHGQCNGGTWRAYATEPKGEHHDLRK